uniref:Transmembrane protein n=1 Tax=Bursaphelenchus xylophilus TaxID=6326 RepID=A0A1I7S9U1_BURXY
MTDKDTVLILFDIFFFLAGVVGSGTAFYFLDKRMDRQRKEKIEKILDMEIQLGKLKATAVAEEEVIGHIKKTELKSTSRQHLQSLQEDSQNNPVENQVNQEDQQINQNHNDNEEDKKDDEERQEAHDEDNAVHFSVRDEGEDEDSPPPSDPRQLEREENEGKENGEEDEEEKDGEEEEKEVETLAPPARHEEIWERTGPAAPKTLPLQRRIFTITEADLRKRHASGKLSSRASISAAEESTVFRPRKVVPLSTDTLRRPIRDNPTVEQQKKQRQVDLGARSMFIMGYFGAWNEAYSEEFERTICEVKVLGRRTLQIRPGLGERVIETKIGTYSCIVELDEPVEFDKIPQIPTYEDDVQDEFKFDIPPNNCVLLNYDITIDEARNMPHDGVYIEYNIEVPENMEVVQKEHLSGRTQVCFVKPEGKDDVSYFSYPIQFALLYRATRPQTDKFFWPRIRLRCLAEDYWGRFYIDGYGSKSLPIRPIAQEKLVIQTWRPKNPFSHLAKLREGFIGQAVDLANPEMAGIFDSTGRISRISSKIGVSAEGSGTVGITVSCLHQSRHYIPQDVIRTMHYERMVEQIGLNSSLYWRIRKVLAQFDEAKRQLIKLRRRPIP